MSHLNINEQKIVRKMINTLLPLDLTLKQKSAGEYKP